MRQKGVVLVIDFILCDDQASHNQTLMAMISSVCEKKSIAYRFACVTTIADEVLQHVQNHSEAAIYFLDICLDENDLDSPLGIDLCGKILAYSPKSCVIYVSAYQQYALSCCQSHAFDFLVKPFDEKRLSCCLEAAIRDITMEPVRKSLLVQSGSRTITLDEDDIFYIEKQREYCIAHCQEGTTVWRESFTTLLTRLSRDFIQIHRGYIVNITKVNEFNFGDDVVSIKQADIQLPIARRHKAELKTLLAEVNRQ